MVIEPSETTSLDYVYTTALRINRLLGYFGVQQWSDHDDSGTPDTKVITDSIYAATDEMNMYLLRIYSPADLVQSALVIDWTTKLAAYRLCINRGNDPPKGLVSEIEGIRASLHDLKSGALMIPGLNTTFSMAPTMTNRVVDRKYPRKSVRVDKQTSTPDQSDMVQHVHRSYQYYLQ